MIAWSAWRRSHQAGAQQAHVKRTLQLECYGASTIAGGDGSRQPSRVELDGVRFQGKHVAQIAAKLSS
ncbi:MAG TPA: hypothetical protein VF590_02925 [Isosphaeraceae bacterium]